VDLSDDEALVLFELLDDYGSKGDGRTLTILHAAERNALWALAAQLETGLVAPFEPNYSELLSGARARDEEQGGSW
jgi:hypothetical protein